MHDGGDDDHDHAPHEYELLPLNCSLNRVRPLFFVSIPSLTPQPALTVQISTGKASLFNQTL